MDDTIVTETTLVLNESELALLRTALGLLIATLGHEEADELRLAQELRARLDPAV